jgi:hypothetical protein
MEGGHLLVYPCFLRLSIQILEYIHENRAIEETKRSSSSTASTVGSASATTCTIIKKPNNTSIKRKQVDQEATAGYESYTDENQDNHVIWRVAKREGQAVKSLFISMLTLFLCQLKLLFALGIGAKENIIDEASFKRLKNQSTLWRSIKYYYF